jgi:hypothetical protein
LLPPSTSSRSVVCAGGGYLCKGGGKWTIDKRSPARVQSLATAVFLGRPSMANIVIKDLELSAELDRQAMTTIRAGNSAGRYFANFGSLGSFQSINTGGLGSIFNQSNTTQSDTKKKLSDTANTIAQNFKS